MRYVIYEATNSRDEILIDGRFASI